MINLKNIFLPEVMPLVQPVSVVASSTTPMHVGVLIVVFTLCKP